MSSRPPIFLLALAAFAFGPPLGEATAQPAGKYDQPASKWWSPVATARGETPSPHVRSSSRARSSSRGRSGPPVVPKGHRPPPGLCRLWYPGQPPGKQPPPMSCREAYRQQRGQAFVVTHRGTVRGGPPARWRRRPAEDIVFRRSPPEEGVVVDVDIIIDVLGRDGYRRLQNRKRRLGVRGALRARWVSIGPSGRGVLQVRVGPHPLAELADQNGDGRVESMLRAPITGQTTSNRPDAHGRP